MVEVIGVRFRKTGKIYYFLENGEKLELGTSVIVETSKGIEFGKVELLNKFISEKELFSPLKTIIRVATEEDKNKYKENKEYEKKAFKICVEKIKEFELDMKVIDTELTFDCNKITFYFISEGRIDFRDLVKSLASIFKMRIELRQIGVRDEAKMLNGIGICGRPLCCSTFLSNFQPVSIKMAKDQNLPLNPSKISGVCGRFMCCLKYEEENYKYINEFLPKEGDIVRTVDGEGEVLSVTPLRQLVKVAIKKNDKDDPKVIVYDATEVQIISSKNRRTNKFFEEDIE